MLKINKIWRATTSRESGLRGSFLALLVLCTSLSYAQNDLTQTLRGRVLDAVTNAPIPSASVILSKNGDGTTSNTEGVFRFEKIAVGRYNVSVRCLGFQSITLTDVVVETGKEKIIELKMTASSTLLDSFEVRSTTADIAKIGLAQSVSMEALQRLPATFNDVARMLTTVAGVTTENDAANHISVRGLTPNAIQWYLEGAEIVNPNHLSNAGTGNDRATQNGGGVSIFSTQVLERADFYKGSTPTGYGNALGGAIDVRFRKGNDDHQETTLGIGLIGLDAATEGVFSKKSKASYLINGRYATVGLLSKLGVPLGDEASNYQDVSFKLNFPTQKMGEFAVFGMGGISENVFLHKKRDKWETQKDSQDITFTNRMGAIGASHSINLGNNTSWQTVVALSGLESRRLAMGLNSFEVATNVVDFTAIHRKFFIKSQINQQYKAGVLSAGLVVKNEFVDNLNTYKYKQYTPYTEISKGQGMWYMPFADFAGKIGSKWAYSIGVRGNYFSFTDKLSVEPTAMIQRKMGQNGSIKLTYSRQSQLLTPPQYFRQNGTQYYSKNKDFIKSDNFNLAYHQYLSNNVQFSVTAFGQFYQNIFVIDPQFPPRDYWSILDGFGGSDNFGGMAGTAQSIGIEASISQNNRNGWFWQVNTTLFDATYKDPNGNVHPMAYNSHYIFNGYIGKEWLLRGRKNRFMGVGSRTILRGGNYQYPIIYNTKSPEVAPYFRTDLNVYVKRNRKNWSSTLQLDIQNVTNRENEQYYYYDSFKQKGDTQYQLGLLPNLSYKIAF
jgi:hypothetical protein